MEHVYQLFIVIWTMGDHIFHIEDGWTPEQVEDDMFVVIHLEHMSELIQFFDAFMEGTISDECDIDGVVHIIDDELVITNKYVIMIYDIMMTGDIIKEEVIVIKQSFRGEDDFVDCIEQFNTIVHISLFGFHAFLDIFE